LHAGSHYANELITRLDTSRLPHVAPHVLAVGHARMSKTLAHWNIARELST
jgi:hypothetical protein